MEKIVKSVPIYSICLLLLSSIAYGAESGQKRAREQSVLVDGDVSKRARRSDVLPIFDVYRRMLDSERSANSSESGNFAQHELTAMVGVGDLGAEDLVMSEESPGGIIEEDEATADEMEEANSGTSDRAMSPSHTSNEASSSRSAVAPLPLSERFKTLKCKTVCNNPTFQEFIKEISERSTQLPLKEILSKYSSKYKKKGYEYIDLQGLTEWVVWAAQHDADRKIRDFAKKLYLKNKAIRMNDAFKVFLVDRLPSLEWSLKKVREEWNKNDNNTENIGQGNLQEYMIWARDHESLLEMKILARKHCHYQPSANHKKNKMKSIPGLKDFFDQNYRPVAKDLVEARAEAKRLADIWNAMPENKDKPRKVAWDCFDRYITGLMDTSE